MNPGEGFGEEQAERMFDRLGEGVADERPAVAELVAAARVERGRRRRTTGVWLAAAAASALVLGGVALIGGRGLTDADPDGVAGRPEPTAVVSAAQLTGTWRSPSGEEISYLPAAVGDGVEYVTDGGSGELDPATAGFTLVDDELVRAGVSYTRVAPSPTAAAPGLTPVDSVNQITGTWDVVRLVGHPAGERSRALVVTTSWLSVGGRCAVYQADYEVGEADLVLGAFEDHPTSTVCELPGQAVPAAVATASSLALDGDRLLLAFDADGVETAAFRRADPLPGPSAPELAGRWRPVGATDAELTLSVRPGPTSGRVSARSGDCEIAGIWYLTEDGTFVSAVGPTTDPTAGCDDDTPDLDAFENISRAELTDGQLVLRAPSGQELVRYDAANPR